MKKYAMPFIMLAVFESVAIVLWLTRLVYAGVSWPDLQ
mgnify:CR=1 FL=1